MPRCSGLVVVVLLLSLVGFVRADVVAQVGGAAITSEDVALRQATERAYGNLQVTTEAALVSLIQDALFEAVAREQGLAPSAEDVSALAAHAETESKSPQVLARVQAALGDEAYDRLFLQPKVVNRKLHEFFQSSATLQQVVEDGAGFQIFRVLSRDERSVEVETVRVGKADFEDWFRGKAASLAVQIVDATVRQNIEARYAGLWWLANLH